MEDQQHVNDAKQGKEPVSAHQHQARISSRIALAPRTCRHKANAKAQQCGKHWQPAYVQKHGRKDRSNLVECAVWAHTAKGGTRLVQRVNVVDHPRLHRIGHGNAHEGKATRKVGD